MEALRQQLSEALAYTTSLEAQLAAAGLLPTAAKPGCAVAAAAGGSPRPTEPHVALAQLRAESGQLRDRLRIALADAGEARACSEAGAASAEAAMLEARQAVGKQQAMAVQREQEGKLVARAVAEIKTLHAQARPAPHRPAPGCDHDCKLAAAHIPYQDYRMVSLSI